MFDVLKLQLGKTLSVLISLALLANASASDPRFEQLGESIQKLCDQHDGTVAIAIEFIESGHTIFINEDQVMPTASLIKLAVMHEAYDQANSDTLDLSKKIILKEEDKVPGSGILSNHFSEGLTLSLHDAIHLMITYSDNTATNLVLDQVGLQQVCDGMAKMGLAETRINAKVYRGSSTSISPERSELYGLGSTTAKETLSLLKQIYQKNAVSKSASEAMLSHLFTCDDDTKIAAGFPTGTPFAHKTGAISHARCDAGIVEVADESIVLVVLTANNRDQSWTNSNQALELCKGIGSLVYTHAASQTSTSTADSNKEAKKLSIGAFGRLVEDLQRTLNAKLEPSASLSVDGDFGPATRAAVIRFQEAKGLTADGIFDQDDWKALGTLITEDEPAPEPSIANRQELPSTPADSLEGPPFVTAKAWAIANLDDGTVLFESNLNDKLDIASTTKIMTAYLVLELAEKNPSVLSEQILFSEKADQTRGSTCGIRAGEIVSVEELLFGLLLPSGNDAAIALAEHFGSRLVKKTAEQESDELFVIAMNEKAQSLGMTQTHFCNPHGLTEPGHLSSANDLAKLTCAAMRFDSFRRYVKTRQHGCQLDSKSGYRRNVLWRNTNQLLEIDGYTGVKTGTTTAAGACLVSACQRDEQEIIMVLLGSSSSRGRYADSRNLYRWAWNELSKP
ncbi:MAG: serine hydrolase [Rubripirellula sp.]